MIYAIIKTPEDDAPGLYSFKNWKAYRDATRDTECTVQATANTSIARRRKRCYQAEKIQAEDALHQLNDLFYTEEYQPSYSELWTIQNAAEKLARQYGFIREARENGLC